MENQNQQELSLEQLFEMSNFNLDDEQEDKKSDIDLTLTSEDEEQEVEKEVKKEEEETPTEVKTEVEKNQNNNFYHQLLKSRLKSGEWEDVIVDLGEEGEKKLSEIEYLDEDSFNDIDKAISEEKQKVFDTKYLSIDGLDETQVKLINIIKNGNLEQAREIFENPQELQEPFQGYDPDNEEHNKRVLKWYFTSRGDDESDAELLIEKAAKDLTLDKKAQQIVDFQKKAFKENLEKKNQSLIEEKQKEEQEIKEYRKNLTSSLKEEGLPETAVRKFVDSATKKSKSGNFEIDDIYDETMKDPKKAADLMFFLLDRENYIKKVSSGAKKDAH